MTTIVGDNNLFMVSAHVAHDVRIGSHNVVANSAAIAGHVEVGDRVTIGGLVGIHQFVRIGDLAILSGGSMVAQDVPPFCMVQGDRARLIGLNSVGLERALMSKEAVRLLRKLFRELFGRRSCGITTDRLENMVAELAELDAVLSEPANRLIQFVKCSTRGICSIRRGRVPELQP
jgi:UDP-N-acetylglucosamine acyltransferase